MTIMTMMKEIKKKGTSNAAKEEKDSMKQKKAKNINSKQI